MELSLHLHEPSHTPIYRRLTTAIKGAITDGRLGPGDALPSVRQLGSVYGISRLTVMKSYQDLESQGYIETRPGLGSRVRSSLPPEDKISAVESTRCAPPATPFSQDIDFAIAPQRPESYLAPQLNWGLPSADLLPLTVWKRLLNQHCQNQQALTSYRHDANGLFELRKALSRYLARSRALTCSPDQIFIFAGVEHALHLLARIVMPSGHTSAIEDPGPQTARRILQLHGSVHYMPVDKGGITIDTMQDLPETTKLIYSTPSHHTPSGAVLEEARREPLLRTAKRLQAIIVEDDNDCEFRYGSAALPSLWSMDENESVAYLQSFWKTLGPMVRLAFIVVPRHLVSRFADAKALIEPDFPVLEQYALADFINSGMFERHIQSLRKSYTPRRQTLVRWLTLTLGRLVKIAPETSGTFMMVRFDPMFTPEALESAAQKADFPIISSQRFYHQTDHPSNEYLLPFAHRQEEQIELSALSFANHLNMKAR